MPPTRHRHHARHRSRNDGLPGWAWLLIGAVLALAVILLAPNAVKSDGEDGFFRASLSTTPQPPISALEQEQPAPTSTPSTAAATPAPAASATSRAAPAAAAVTEPEYDFYTVLPAQNADALNAETAADAAELAAPPPGAGAPARPAPTPASASPSAVRPASTSTQRSPPTPAPTALPRPPAGSTRAAATAPTSSTTSRSTASSQPAKSAATAPAAAPEPEARTARTGTAAAGSGQRTLLQAGAFVAVEDAEALKARIALLGLHARVESGRVDGQAVYRVRLGPYANARELAAAKQRLDNGGLPSREVRGQ